MCSTRSEKCPLGDLAKSNKALSDVLRGVLVDLKFDSDTGKADSYYADYLMVNRFSDNVLKAIKVLQQHGV